jgi:hypothetical protein
MKIINCAMLLFMFGFGLFDNIAEASASKDKKSKTKLPIPLLYKLRLPKSENLAIFRSDNLKKHQQRPETEKTKPLSKRPVAQIAPRRPPKVERISINHTPSFYPDTILSPIGGRKQLDLKKIEQKAPTWTKLVIYRYWLGRKRWQRRWMGDIVIAKADGIIRYQCSSLTSCHSLKKQISDIVKQGVFRDKKRLVSTHPRFAWYLRRMIELKHHYEIDIQIH